MLELEDKNNGEDTKNHALFICDLEEWRKFCNYLYKCLFRLRYDLCGANKNGIANKLYDVLLSVEEQAREKKQQSTAKKAKEFRKQLKRLAHQSFCYLQTPIYYSPWKIYTKNEITTYTEIKNIFDNKINKGVEREDVIYENNWNYSFTKTTTKNKENDKYKYEYFFKKMKVPTMEDKSNDNIVKALVPTNFDETTKYDLRIESFKNALLNMIDVTNLYVESLKFIKGVLKDDSYKNLDGLIKELENAKNDIFNGALVCDNDFALPEKEFGKNPSIILCILYNMKNKKELFVCDDREQQQQFKDKLGEYIKEISGLENNNKHDSKQNKTTNDIIKSMLQMQKKYNEIIKYIPRLYLPELRASKEEKKSLNRIEEVYYENDKPVQKNNLQSNGEDNKDNKFNVLKKQENAREGQEVLLNTEEPDKNEQIKKNKKVKTNTHKGKKKKKNTTKTQMDLKQKELNNNDSKINKEKDLNKKKEKVKFK